MKRLRQFIESIVFAGMRPGATAAAPRDGMKWLGPLRAPLERFLSGGAAPSDPFYLTNRTAAERAKTWLLIGIPCVIVLAAIGIAISGFISARVTPPAQLTSKQIAAKMLPNIPKDLKLEGNSEVNVMDVHIDRGPENKVSGLLRNNSDRVLREVQVVFEVTAASGTRLGAVSTTVMAVQPHETAKFSFSIEQRDAAFALVRETHVQ